MIGRALSHYTIVTKLGSGGMGEVYLAEDEKLDRQVALKILPAELATRPELRARFEREAKAIAALNHPHIVTIYSVEEAEGVHFITMELVKGKSLTEIHSGRALPLDELFEIAIPLADAVDAAHQQGITHRDLKPDNIMVNDEGRLKILDFGLAKLRPKPSEATASELPTQSMTGRGLILGTVAYMSPEQAEGERVDHRSDIFSLGIILYEMATGTRPFKGASAASIMASILKDSPDPVTDVNPALPRELGRIIRRCLSKEVDRRYQTAKDLRNDLEELKSELQSGEMSAGKPVGPSRVGWRTVGVVVTIVTLVGLLTYLALRSSIGKETTSPSVRLQQLTSSTGVEFFPSLSPDGNMFVYCGSDAGNFDIYLQRVGGEKAINLTEDTESDDVCPVFSPRGDRIAFRSNRDGGGIFVMGATGESVTRLTDFGFNPAWSPDGDQIVFASSGVFSHQAQAATSRLWIVDVETKEAVPLTDEGISMAFQPSWSPSGHRIAYWSFEGGQRDIWNIPAEGGNPVRITQSESIDWNPEWSPGGRFIYFSSDRGGTMGVWRVPVDERTGTVHGEPQLLTSSLSDVTGYLSIGRDGKHVAYAVMSRRQNLQRVTLDPSNEKVVGEPEWITNATAPGFTEPAPSPDGEWIAFVMGGGGEAPDIGILRKDGTGRRNLTEDSYRNWSPAWSPDGKRIAFHSNRSGRYQLWCIDADGRGLHQMSDTEFQVFNAVWSPDGSKVAGLAVKDDGRYDTYLFPTGDTGGPSSPELLPRHRDENVDINVTSWSPDGERLAGTYSSEDSTGIAVFSFASREWKKISDRGREPVWMSDGRRLIVEVGQGFVFLDSQTGRYREIVTLSSDTMLSADFGLSRDDSVIYLSTSSSQADIWLMTLANRNR